MRAMLPSCTTCHLGQSACPGHPGHIELVVPVYHPVFMDQAFRLLKAQCRYCYRFRLARRRVHRYICMFRLLQAGLVREAFLVDAIEEDFHGLEVDGVPTRSKLGVDSDDDSEGGGAGDGQEDGIMEARNAFVRKELQRNQVRPSDIRLGKHEGALQARHELIKEFLAELVQGSRKCSHCQGTSPGYRKDRYVKIFEKILSPKEDAARKQRGFRLRDAVDLDTKAKPASGDNDYLSDEGVADLGWQPDQDTHGAGDSSAENEEDEEQIGAGEELDEAGEVVPRQRSTRGMARVPVAHQRYLNTTEVLERLKRLFELEQVILSLIYNAKPAGQALITADMLFLHTIFVPPNRFRPEARMGDNQVSEAPQNNLYKMIMRSSSKVARVWTEIQQSQHAGNGAEQDGHNREPRDMTALHEAWTELQDSVNSLVDKNKNPVRGPAAKRNEDGIKQRLEKKEGLFRKNMMGKRVNYAARSVISPDPNIETNEIGVPPVFAKKLTYPEPVTSHNFRDMQEAVIRGVSNWPGASAVENENGQVINLRGKSREERIAMANQLLTPSTGSGGNHHPRASRGHGVGGDEKPPRSSNMHLSPSGSMRNKKVHRHLTNGDVVLMNRQPTLHKPSIMGHRVRVLPGEKTIRMHYANCNTYNADFDGDEMNMHFPQNEIARAEALQLADTDHQYESSTQGKPLRGLIQDHLSVSVALCSRDTMFNRGDYQQLIYSALRPENGQITGDKIEVVPPAIIKPLAQWTGKQVITTVLMNIQPKGYGALWMEGKTQISSHLWGVEGAEEGQVLFQDGVLVSGILDKSQLGPSPGGLVHSIHEVYGPAVAGKFLSSMGRLLTRFLAMRAFSCGMDDLRMTEVGEEARRKALSATGAIGLGVASKYVSLNGDDDPSSRRARDPKLLHRLEAAMRDDRQQEGLDLLMTRAGGEVSSAVTKACVPAGLEKHFPQNQMQSMTNSGAKGSSVNANLISCNLGQQVLEGRRVPLMVSGKSLPCFEPFDVDLRAGGFVRDRFLTGIRPQEYYFHHMAGREGLIDTAVKTSRSGYLQRCLVKGLEGLGVAYDSSVRDSDGSVVQFLYGEDGIDVTKQRYLSDFRFLLENRQSEAARLPMFQQADHPIFGRRDELAKTMKKAIRGSKGPTWWSPDPVNTHTDPTQSAFATSERYSVALMDYLRSNPDGLVKAKGDTRGGVIGRKFAERLLVSKYNRSLLEPGEAVGIVAGQSVGEPSTQMTLNTFHLAGHSARNVTLGIPRLREILMTASVRISTPTMTLVLNEGLSSEEGEQFAKSMSILPLSHVVDHMTMYEHVARSNTGSGALVRKYEIQLRFYSVREFEETYAVGIIDVLDAAEMRFAPLLNTLISKTLRKRKAGDDAAMPEVGIKSGQVEILGASLAEDAPTTPLGAAAGLKGNGINDDNDDNEDDETGDGDATSAKQRANRDEAVSYGPNDEEDEVVQQQMARHASPDVSLDPDNEQEDEAYGGSPLPTGKMDKYSSNEHNNHEDRVAHRLGYHDSAADSESNTNMIDLDVDGFNHHADQDQGVDGDAAEDDKDDDSSDEDDHDDARAEREARVTAKFDRFTEFQCDERRGRWCRVTVELPAASPKLLMLKLAQQAAIQSLIREVPGLGTCTFVADEKLRDQATGDDVSNSVIHTVGCNIRAAQEMGDHINPNRILTNDIAAVLAAFGVEACRSSIIRELRAVFASHGITVDVRHLSLIADHMTRNGGFTPFNRIGLTGNVSPFTKMSFETTLAFLRDAVLDGDWDNITSPSSRLVMGRIGHVGTGAFDVLTAVPT
jgi:DNA-directed RNA polymerase I subunit RPA1